MTRWSQAGSVKIHIFEVPFYYIEYGLASLGAFQVWANAMKDQKGAIEAYRRALALGGTVSIPELYSTAGARFAMDADILNQVIGMIEHKISELEQV